MSPQIADVGIRGLRGLDRALGKADKTLRADLRTRLKEVADIVAVRARNLAEEKGLHQSGDLIKGIQPYALTGRAGVRSGAMHRGYNYPRRLEYEHGGGRDPGPRATLNPAFEQMKPVILMEAERILDKLAQDFTTGGDL